MNEHPTRRGFLRLSAIGTGALLATGAQAADVEAPAARNMERLWLWPEGAIGPAPAGLAFTSRDRAAPGEAPDREFKGVVRPFVDLVRPERPNGAAILLMPGGGYTHLAADKEGYDLAAWFAQRGVTAGVLVYRLPTEGWPGGGDVPLADAQRAVRLLRAGADARGLDPRRIAVMGFSAGGHLAATLGGQYARPSYRPLDAADRQSARPDLVAPVYAAIELDRLAKLMPPGQSLFGRSDPELLAPFLPHLNVPDAPPPHFLLHAEDDPLVDAGHSLALRAALKAKGGTVETHLFARGGHGFGLRKAAGLPVAAWPDLFLAFGRSVGWAA